MILLSKLEARFHNAGHKNIQFVIVTKNETNAARIRKVSRQLEVVVLNNPPTSEYSLLEDRSVYIFDTCGRIVYEIHYPYSSVQKPFVKAAILSTIYDQPCGSCIEIVSSIFETSLSSFVSWLKNIFRIVTMIMKRTSEVSKRT